MTGGVKLLSSPLTAALTQGGYTMQTTTAQPLTVRTAQFTSYTALVEQLDLSDERRQGLEHELSGGMTWGDADITLVHWSKVLKCLLNTVRRQMQDEAESWSEERLAAYSDLLNVELELVEEKFKRILPSSDFGPLFINLEG